MKIIIPMLFLVPFLIPNQSFALSCASSEDDMWFASYENGVYTDGFIVEYELTGNWCDERPILGTGAEKIEEVFDKLITNLSETSKTGVFKVSTKCLSRDWAEGCFPSSSVEKISDDTEDLKTYELSWQQKEQNATRISTTHKWFTFGLMVVMLSLIVLWPWVLILRWPHLQTRVSALLIAAIPIQVVSIWVVPMFVWSYPLISTTSRFAASALILIIVIEFLYILFRFIKRNKGKTFPNMEKN